MHKKNHRSNGKAKQPHHSIRYAEKTLLGQLEQSGGYQHSVQQQVQLGALVTKQNCHQIAYDQVNNYSNVGITSEQRLRTGASLYTQPTIMSMHNDGPSSAYGMTAREQKQLLNRIKKQRKQGWKYSEADLQKRQQAIHKLENAMKLLDMQILSADPISYEQALKQEHYSLRQQISAKDRSLANLKEEVDLLVMREKIERNNLVIELGKLDELKTERKEKQQKMLALQRHSEQVCRRIEDMKEQKKRLLLGKDETEGQEQIRQLEESNRQMEKDIEAVQRMIQNRDRQKVQKDKRQAAAQMAKLTKRYNKLQQIVKQKQQIRQKLLNQFQMLKKQADNLKKKQENTSQASQDLDKQQKPQAMKSSSEDQFEFTSVSQAEQQQLCMKVLMLVIVVCVATVIGLSLLQ